MSANIQYPLLLKPVIKDYLWGGTRLKTEFGFETDKEIAAEGWMLSCHKDGTNTVENGAYAGKPLDEVLKHWGYEEKFPILIKLIDAKDRLSVQVHPDNKYALENEGEYGKTEMWYVVDCDDGAELIYGFNREVSREELERRIKDNTLPEICNYVPVHKGDVFFIAAGTLHAIGAGILIAEVQQNSNTTYRVSDYGRIGADGKPRPLHIEKALDVTKRERPQIPYGNTGKFEKTPYGTVRELAKCSLFTASLLELDGKTEIHREDSFTSLLVLEGKVTVKWKDGEIEASKGVSIFVPADCLTELSGETEILISKV